MQNSRKNSSFLGTGWAFPPVFELADKQLAMTAKNDNIKQSINTILQTPCGERSLMPEFGCRLHTCLFRQFDSTLQAEIVDIVHTALLDFEPRIGVESVTVKATGAANDLQGFEVQIRYFIRMTNSRHNHVFPYSQTQATNLVINDG
jgi:phage baseplate assembly protein W